MAVSSCMVAATVSAVCSGCDPSLCAGVLPAALAAHWPYARLRCTRAISHLQSALPTSLQPFCDTVTLLSHTPQSSARLLCFAWCQISLCVHVYMCVFVLRNKTRHSRCEARFMHFVLATHLLGSIAQTACLPASWHPPMPQVHCQPAAVDIRPLCDRHAEGCLPSSGSSLARWCRRGDHVHQQL